MAMVMAILYIAPYSSAITDRLHLLSWITLTIFSVATLSYQRSIVIGDHGEKGWDTVLFAVFIWMLFVFWKKQISTSLSRCYDLVQAQFPQGAQQRELTNEMVTECHRWDDDDFNGTEENSGHELWARTTRRNIADERIAKELHMQSTRIANKSQNEEEIWEINPMHPEAELFRQH